MTSLIQKKKLLFSLNRMIHAERRKYQTAEAHHYTDF